MRHSGVGRVSVGVDLERMERFRPLRPESHRHFLERVYTAAEIKASFGEACPWAALAERFTAKEAVYKALARFGVSDAWGRNVEVLRDRRGRLSAAIKAVRRSPYKIDLSIFSGTDMAMAVAVVRSV